MYGFSPSSLASRVFFRIEMGTSLLKMEGSTSKTVFPTLERQVLSKRKLGKLLIDTLKLGLLIVIGLPSCWQALANRSLGLSSLAFDSNPALLYRFHSSSSFCTSCGWC